MNFLIDIALSIVVSEGLKEMGYDIKHVIELGLQDAEDQEIFELALKENRTIISADSDFSWLLSKLGHNKPSVILFRKGSERDPKKQIQLLRRITQKFSGGGSREELIDRFSSELHVTLSTMLISSRM